MKRGEPHRCGAGFSLVELLVSMGLGTLVLATALALVVGHARWSLRLRQEAQALAGLHWAMQRIASDLYMTGLDPQQRYSSDISSGISSDSERDNLADRFALGMWQFSRAADLDGDGQVDKRSSESVTIFVSPEGDLMREVGRQRMPLLEGLRPAGFELQGVDRFGAFLARPVAAPTSGSGVARVLFKIDTVDAGALASSVALRWVFWRDRLEFES